MAPSSSAGGLTGGRGEAGSRGGSHSLPVALGLESTAEVIYPHVLELQQLLQPCHLQLQDLKGDPQSPEIGFGAHPSTLERFCEEQEGSA